MSVNTILVSSFVVDQLQNFETHSEKNIQLKFQSDCANDIALMELVGNQVAKLKDIVQLQMIFQQNTSLKLEGWKYIFQGLEQLSQLESLELVIKNSCFLEDQGLNLFVYAVSSLTNLKKLIIDIQKSNYISTSSVKNLVNNLKFLDKIEDFTLKLIEYRVEDLDDEKLNIWQGLSHLKQIKKLNLSLNLLYISQKDFEDLLQALLSFKQLTKIDLDLDYKNQDIHFLKQLTICLEQLVYLKELTLSLAQKLQGKEEIFLITNFFRKLINLEKIDISKCFQNFGYDQTDQYYESIGYLPHLQDLQLEFAYDNQQIVSKDFEIKRANCLSNKKSLQKLQIISNQIDLRDETYIQLFQNLKNNTTIQYLILNLKSIQKEQLSQDIIESFKLLRDLQQLSFKTDIYNSNIILVNKILEAIGKIQSLKQLNLEFNNLSVYSARKQDLAFSHLKQLNLQSFYVQVDAMVLGKEFQELGQVLQKQANLQNLSLIIKFEITVKQLFNFGNQQKQSEKQNTVESFEDFIEGIKSLKNLKQLKYGITHSESRYFLNEILVSIQHLQSLESIEVIYNHDYEHTQIDLLFKSISCLYNLKKITFDNLRSIDQVTYSNQLQYLSSLKNLEHLHFTSNRIKLTNSDCIGYEQLFSNLTKLKTAYLIVEMSQNQDQDFFKGLSYLQNLQKLTFNLENYEFTDLSIKYFSQACESLSSLNELTISLFNIDNNFTEKGAQTLQEAFCKLNKLKFLDAHFLIPNVKLSKTIEGFFKNKYLNRLSIQIETKEDIDVEEIPHNQELVIENQTEQFPNFNITEMCLYFYYCLNFQKEDFSKFYERMKDLQNLNNLQICYDWDLSKSPGELIEITSILAKMFACLGNLKRIQQLKLEFLNSKYSLEEVPVQNMKYLSNLKQFELTLKNDNIMQDCLLFDQFQYFKQLQVLIVEINQASFSKDAAISFGNSLQNLKQLLKFYLILGGNNCQIGPEGATQLGKGIGCLKYLRELKIQLDESCQIKEIGAIKLAEGISKISQLLSLFLDIKNQNNIGKQGGASLAASIRNSKNLRYLYFQILKEGNEQGQEFINEISESLKELKQLQKTIVFVCFDEVLKFCPQQLKEFISFACNSNTQLKLIKELEYNQSNIISEGYQRKLQLVFSYNKCLSEFIPLVEIGCLQDISGEDNLEIVFEFNKNTNKSQIANVSEQIQNLKTRNLRFKIQFYQYEQLFVNELIIPAIKNQNLSHLSLVLNSKIVNQIDSDYFVLIGQHLNKLNLITLRLSFRDSNFTQSYYNKHYQKILQQLKHQNTIRCLSLYRISEVYKTYPNVKYIHRLVTFSVDYQD
ncbi:hypothetical protein ABPG74_000756 [Tetrahymena malaccensis]